MKFSKFINGKSLSLANLLSKANLALANEIKKGEFLYISSLEDEILTKENLIRCEIGSISFVLALLCKFSVSDKGKFKEYFDELDDGALSGECNVGEEEFKELSQWLGDAKNIIIDSSFFTHPDSKMLFEFLEILDKNVVLADSDIKEFKTDGILSELKELSNFDGSVVYLYHSGSDLNKDELIGSAQFSLISKAKDSDLVSINGADFSAKAKFRLDSALKGTIARINMSENFNGYCFKSVKIKVINER